MSDYRFLIGLNALQYTPQCATEDMIFPSSNLAILNSRVRRFQSTNTLDTYISFDLRAVKGVVGIVIIDANFTLVRVQASSDGNWSSPYEIAGLSMVGIELSTGRYNRFIDLRNIPCNFQYIRLVIPSQAPIDGGSVFKIGSVALYDQLISMNKTASYGYVWKALEEVAETKFMSGGSDVISLSDPIVEVTFDYEMYPDENMSDIWAINRAGKSGIVTFFENFEDPSRVLIGQLKSDIAPSYDNVGEYGIKQITIRECA